MIGSSGVARVSRAAARLADAGSAPSLSVMLNVAKQKSSSREADIGAELGEDECVSSRGCWLRKARPLSLHESDKSAVDLIRGRGQGRFSLSAISAVAR
jgi:hypothetical protein